MASAVALAPDSHKRSSDPRWQSSAGARFNPRRVIPISPQARQSRNDLLSLNLLRLI